MFAPPVMQLLAGDRLHLSHGPIDLVLKAWGQAHAVRDAYAAAWTRFPRILPELCDELTLLRTPIDVLSTLGREAARPALVAGDAAALADDRPSRGVHASCPLHGPVALRMFTACVPFAGEFLTPMAAVAGAVADELLAHMQAAAVLDRAFVNNGGDIAVHVAPGHRLDVGIAGEFSRGAIPALNGRLALGHEEGVGGIATSGARGRSFSLGIADAVTVLARDAASADAAATLIANAVDVNSPAVTRRPASDLDPDSDLGARLVTVAVAQLTDDEIHTALTRGLARAKVCLGRGQILGAALMLGPQVRTCGVPARPSAIAAPAPISQSPKRAASHPTT